MKDGGYIFTCTPCGKPHAGECPPKDDLKISVTYAFDPDSIEKAKDTARSILNSTNAIIGSPFLGTGQWPPTRSRWESEISDDGGATWKANSITYEVVTFSVVNNTVTVRYAIDSVTGTPFDLKRGYWDQLGDQNPTGSMSRMRRIP